MAAGKAAIVSEVLWFLKLKFAKVCKSDLCSVLNTFYTNEEIVCAKKLLFDFAEPLKVDNLPSFTERKGVNKLRANIDDILGLYTILDANKIECPMYTVLDIRRVPPSASTLSSATDVPHVVDVLTTMVNDLRQQVAVLVDKVDKLSTHSCHKLHLPVDQPAACSDGQLSSSVSVLDAPERSSVDVRQPSWAAQAASLALDTAAFKVVTPRPPSRRPAVRTGKGLVTERVKAVPRYLTCFVGRINKDTTAEDLQDYLAQNGVVAQCRLLEDKDGKFRTAAFRVSCLDTYKELFYDENNWPEGAELRDWVFRHRDG
jgi:hypothetical protein